MIGTASLWTTRLVLGVCLVCLVGNVDAAAPVLIRNSLTKPGPVWVGERVAITVELLTPEFFSGAPVFQLPTIPQVILMQIEDRPVLSTEQIDDTTYNVQQHELALFARQPGVYEVPPFTVRFASVPRFGEPAVEHRLSTQAMRVEVRLPPGAESLPGLISTRELEVTQTWQPEPKKGARLGDAFTRTITLTAPDVPGMVFPPLPLAKVEGLAVYPQPPVVQDQVERGAFTGQRTQTVAYVCEGPGSVTLPALVIPWWDVEQQTLMQATLPALTLEVMAASRWRPWWPLGAGLVLVVGAAVCWRKRRMVCGIWERWQAQHQVSEAGCFSQLQKACRANDAVAAYNALLRWLECTHHGPGSATLTDDLLAEPADADLRHNVETLQEAVLHRATHWHGTGLATALHKTRRARQRHATAAAEEQLPALNPR
jgi:hypothetical protein